MNKEKELVDLFTLASQRVGSPGRPTKKYCKALAEEVERLTRKIERDRAIQLITEYEEVNGSMSYLKFSVRGKDKA